jgi:hypothetical protein
MDRHKLEGLTREELVALAGELGIVRPRSLTVPELIDEIISRTAANERDKARSRGWLGRARSLLASVIERGLHLPEVAKVLRNAPSTRPWPVAPPPLATMTLAEIYAAQGHLDKALQILDEIITREPEHADARSLRQRLQARDSGGKKPETPAKREEPTPLNDSPAVVETAKRAAAPETVETPAEPVAPVVETNTTPVTLPEETEAPVAVAPETQPVEEAVVAPVESTKAEEPVVLAPETAPVAADVDVEEEPAASDSFQDDEPAALDSDWHDQPAIEELPLPERYNVDEIVGIAVDPTTVYVYWEVRPVALARAHARSPAGAMVVRLVSVTPTWDGPIVEQRDLRIDALYGDAYVRGIQPGANVRIGVGWLAHGDFTPFAIGEPVTTPRKERAFATASTIARWMPEGAPAPVASGQTTVGFLAMALEKAVATSDIATLASTPIAERTSFGQRWPTFDLGSRGQAAQAPQRPSRSALGGSSELGLGGASDQVRRAG